MTHFIYLYMAVVFLRILVHRVDILVLGSTSQSFSTAASVNVVPKPFVAMPQSEVWA